MSEAENYPCKTCGHRGQNVILMLFGSPELQSCNRPQRRIDPVTGEREQSSCGLARRYGCGYEGRYHTERPENKEPR